MHPEDCECESCERGNEILEESDCLEDALAELYAEADASDGGPGRMSTSLDWPLARAHAAEMRERWKAKHPGQSDSAFWLLGQLYAEGDRNVELWEAMMSCDEDEGAPRVAHRLDCFCTECLEGRKRKR